MTLGNVNREPEAGKTRDAMDGANVGKGTAVPTCNVGGSPGSRDVNHGSRATSTIGQGNEHQNDTSEQHEKPVPTLESCIQSTRRVENPNTRLILISCSQGILSSSSFSCYLLLGLLVYMYLSQLMRTFTNYLKCIVISP